MNSSESTTVVALLQVDKRLDSVMHFISNLVLCKLKQECMKRCRIFGRFSQIYDFLS